MTIGYHSKGYYFEFEDDVELIVGSSNITRFALLKNVEWDLVIRDNRFNPVFSQMLVEFNDKWNGTYELSRELIDKYVSKLNYAIERWDMDYDTVSGHIVPNYMQRKALKELNRYRAMGMRRALIVAAAGSGKTYLAAFDARNFNPKRLLYIVHEGSILQKSLETFQEIFANEVTYGIYNKDNKDIDLLESFKEKNIKADIIYLDPPYKEGEYENIVDYIIINNILSEDGVLITECDRELNINLDCFKHKKYKYGEIFVNIYWR